MKCWNCGKDTPAGAFPSWLETCPYCGQRYDKSIGKYVTTRRREMLMENGAVSFERGALRGNC